MKRLRVILLFLLLGAIVNVAVAWAIAVTLTYENLSVAEVFWDPIKLSSRDETGQLVVVTWQVYQQRFFGGVDIAAYPGANPSIVDNETTMYVTVDYDNHPTYWSRLSLELITTDGLHSAGRGWPWISMVSDQTRGNNMNWGHGSYAGWDRLDVVDWGIEFVNWPWSNGRPRVLPLRLAWRGFMANTLFYALLFWMPVVVRRRIRHKRSLCVKCAYDLRGAEHEACPECGEEIRKGNPA